ncbi:MAG TPA: hypothetical protein VHH53_12280 [Pseudonocardiaceae bacterium]|nr:hypothetical protein [Pseudonocardiaceae bacterium]
MDFNGHGRVFIGAHPTGGVIGFWQPAAPWTFRTTTPGALLWAELNTWHGALADKIFADLFSYHHAQIGDGVDLDYTTWSRGGQMTLGRLQMNEDWAAPETRAHWTLHFAVDPQTGTDATVDRVLEMGGRVDIDPYDSEWATSRGSPSPWGPALRSSTPLRGSWRRT